MHIETLFLRNFHGFASAEFRFHPKAIVLIGANGTGKSAVLDALAIAASSYFLGVDGINSLTITDDHIRQEVLQQTDGMPTKIYHTPSTVAAEGYVHNQPCAWERARRKKAGGQTTRKDAARIAELAECNINVLKSGGKVTLPFLGAYSAARLGREKRETQKSNSKLIERSPISGYLHALAPESTSWMAERWLRGLEQRALRRQGDAALIHDALKEKVLFLFANLDRPLDDFYVDFEEEQIYVRYKGTDSYVSARHLSSGYKSILALSLDIAHRMATLNGRLGKDAFDDTPGIALIDEIDMHLHPNWQRHILADLLHIFPALQFVVSTHSPYIVQNIHNARIIDTDANEARDVHVRLDKSIEEVAEEQMGVREQTRSLRYTKMVRAAEEYFSLLKSGVQKDSEKAGMLRRRLDELEALYGDDPAYVALLKVERKANGVDDL